MQRKVHRKFKQAGLTLMELIVSLAVVAVVVSGSIALYNSASSSERATAMSRDLMAIASATKALFVGQGTYGTAGTNLNTILVNTKKLPTTISIIPGNPPTLVHQNKGNIIVQSTGSGFKVTMTEVSTDLCITLMTQAAGWTSVQVGTAAARTSFPISPATASADCATGTTMVFTGN